MTIEQRMDGLEQRLGTQDVMVRELRDAMTVTARLEKMHGEIALDHAKWLVAHDKSIEQHDERTKVFDERFANLVSAMEEYMARDRRNQ